MHSTDTTPSAGVVGLSCAVRLQTILPDHDILLVAREWPSPADAPSPDYASMWAGAHVRPIPGDTPQLRREAAWLKATAGEFGRLVREEPAAGVTRTEGLEYFEAPPAEYRALDAASFEASSGLEGYRVLPRAELPADGVQFGFAYSTYCVNPHIYCLGLLRKFVAAGGKTLRHHLRSQWEAYSLHVDVGLVINASGIGFNDARCYPTRGMSIPMHCNPPSPWWMGDVFV